MKVASTISPDFIEGFVESCSDMGFNLDQTQELFRKHCNNALFARPDIYEGFREKIASFDGAVSKSALARYLTPDMISLAEDIRLHYGDDPMSVQLRGELGLPEPSWDNVPGPIKSAASRISQVIDEFDYLPLNQKILLAMMLGGGVGGVGRAMMPSNEDVASGRGAMNRGLRGAFRGAALGAGGAAGMATGSDIAGRFDPGLRLPGMVLGGGLGAWAGNRLAGDIMQ
jgi:hypothetical protein